MPAPTLNASPSKQPRQFFLGGFIPTPTDARHDLRSREGHASKSAKLFGGYEGGEVTIKLTRQLPTP